VSRRDSRRARVPDDGKIDIFCPQCGAQYRVPEDRLEDKLRCKDCDRTFYPKAHAGKRVRPDHTRTYVGFALGAVAIIGLFIARSSMQRSTPESKEAAASSTPVRQANDPRAEAVVKWAMRAGSGDVLAIKAYTDFATFHKQLGVFPPRPYRNLTDKERNDFDLAMIAAFAKHDSMRWFRELDCTIGKVIDSQTDANGGKVLLTCTPKSTDTNWVLGSHAEIEVMFRMENGSVKVTGFATLTKPTPNPNKR
jgi:predicted Zn finger-like uncharacterized protein